MDPLLRDMATLEPQSGIGDEVTEAGNSSKRDKNFSVPEDLLVCSAWSNATTDPAFGMDQQTTPFWKKAHAYWILHKKPDFPLRNPDALMQRFSQIKTDVIKFCGFLALVPARGYSETDRILKAKEMFSESLKKESEGKKYPKSVTFKFEHCWNMLKNDQKWLQVIEKTEAKSKNPIKGPSHSNGIVELDGDDVSSTPISTEIPLSMKVLNTGRVKRKRKVMYDHSPLLGRIEKLHVLTEKFHNEDVILLRDSKMKVDKLVEMKREELGLQKEGLEIQKAGLEMQKEQIEIDKVKLEMEKRKMESDLNKAEMDLAMQEAGFLKVDMSSLTDPDEIIFYQVMRKKIRVKYAGIYGGMM